MKGPQINLRESIPLTEWRQLIFYPKFICYMITKSTQYGIVIKRGEQLLTELILEKNCFLE